MRILHHALIHWMGQDDIHSWWPHLLPTTSNSVLESEDFLWRTKVGTYLNVL